MRRLQIGAGARARRALSGRAPTTTCSTPPRAARGALPARELGPRQLDAALRAPGENEAESERRRDLALRAVTAHIATVDRSIARADRPPRARAIAWVERGDRDARYEVNARRSRSREFLRATLFARTPSVVLTSATIAAEGTLVRVSQRDAGRRRRAGADRAVAVRLRAPSAALHRAAASSIRRIAILRERAAPIVEECLDRTRGRAFVLFTSYARLREVYALLRGRLPFPVKLQGDLPRARCSIGSAATQNAVLFATGTFWEGIDVVGEQLSCVIIDRLPFPVAGAIRSSRRASRRSKRAARRLRAYMIPARSCASNKASAGSFAVRSDRGVMALLDGRARPCATVRRSSTRCRRRRASTHLDELTEFFA